MNLMDTLNISSAGMRVQSDRLKVVAQNIANAGATGSDPNQEPYRRKTIAFRTEMDREQELELIKTHRIGEAQTPFPVRYDPSHPAANAQGYVRLPNVDPIVEQMDMREARRAYEANLNVIESSRAMMAKTLDLLN
jgi:flagellar basal-body rod protein FlgC